MASKQDRYARIEQIEMIGSDGLVTLHNSCAAVLGAGNLGGEVARHLVMLGVGVLLVDRDVVKAENLGTQGFAEDDLGRPKVEARFRYLKSLSTCCRINTIHADIARLGLGTLRNTNLIFCCLDSRQARTIVNEISVRLGLPWIDAAVDGSGTRLFGRVAAYDPRSADSPCYLCPHDHDSLREIMREGAGQSCPVWQWSNSEPIAAPTLALSALGAAVAARQLLWGLKILLGQPEQVSGKELYEDFGRGIVSLHDNRRNPRCLFEHRSLPLTPLGRAVGEVRVQETFEAAESRLGGSVTFQLHRSSLVTEMRCPACGTVKRPCRLLEAMDAAEAACACGASMQPVASGLLDRFGRREAAGFMNVTWQDLGLPPQGVVTAASARAKVHFLFNQ